MRKLLILLLFIGIIAPGAMAQKRIKASKVPPIVVTNFTARCPAATRVKWRHAEALHFGSYMQSGKLIEATFQSTGDWVETFSEIDIKDLPEAVVKGVYNVFTVATIKAAARVEGADKKIQYMLELKFKGRKVEMTFDESGTQVS